MIFWGEKSPWGNDSENVQPFLGLQLNIIFIDD